MPAAPPPPPDDAAEPVFDDRPRSAPDAPQGTSEGAGRTVDEGRGRVFPCPRCGADLEFNIGQQTLKCPFCGYEETIALPADEPVVERDLEATLETLKDHHDAGRHSFEGMREVRCGSCGGTVVFQRTLTSTRCPYCAAPIQIDKAVQAQDRIAVDGVLPFQVEKDKAARGLAEWVGSRWFAPNDFLKQGVRADFNGVYLPYWTFDAMTFTRYSGQRGDRYTVTVGIGKDQRTETRVRWWPASGSFERFFDDVLVVASRGLNDELIRELEPWPLAKVDPYNQQMLAGFLARTYDVELRPGFEQARARIKSALEADVRGRIGGDEQRISSMDIRQTAVTFKHLLLPVWLMAYRYHAQPYRVYVNATTGEVQGERPYSWLKITLAVIAGLLLALVVYLLLAASQR